MKEIQATIIRIDPTDVLSAINRVEELRKQLVDKEREAGELRQKLEAAEQNTRKQLERFPALLDEFNAELIELARRQEERSAREGRIAALRKQTQQ